jgi:hypothetical protein
VDIGVLARKKIFLVTLKGDLHPFFRTDAFHSVKNIYLELWEEPAIGLLFNNDPVLKKAAIDDFVLKVVRPLTEIEFIETIFMNAITDLCYKKNFEEINNKIRRELYS